MFDYIVGIIIKQVVWILVNARRGETSSVIYLPTENY